MSQSPNLLAPADGRAANQHDERRLAAIVAAAAPFADRVDCELFEPDGDGAADLRDRVAAWLAEAAADPATLRGVVARRAATGREIGAGLRDVRLRDDARLPDWAQALAQFLAAQAPDRAGDDASHEPGAIFESFRRGAAGLLPGDGVVAGIELSADARDDVARALGVRLWHACEPAIEFELRLNREPADDIAVAVVDVSAEGWLRRLEMLPGLAYVVGLTCRQWRASIVEMFGRLRDDMPALRASLWDGAQPGAVTSVSADAGDRHHDGRAVALLGFAEGYGVVYKPKDQRHALAFMQTVDFLNERLALKLHTRAILPRGEYGWEERAVAGPCADEDGFSRYYRRLGMLVRLVQLLEGRDMWADNLLAVGDQPVLTDLECLLYPRVTPPPTLPGAVRELLGVFEETVVRTGLVIQPWVPRPSIPLRDLGCLSHAGDPLEDAPSLPLPPYRPWTEAGIADPWSHGEELLAGYRDMQAALVACRDELRAPDGPLARARSYGELGDDAVHPHSCLLYSERQYDEQADWNSRGSHFNLVPDRFDEDARIAWSPVWSASAGRMRWLPTSYLYFGYPRPAGGFPTPADSNGNAAGTSIEDAALQGFLELVERDSVAMWWYNRVRRPAIDLDSFAEPYIGELRAAYASLGREIWALDLTSDFGIPTVAAMSRRTDRDVEDVVFAFGAHLDPRIALLRALTEMNQFLPAVMHSVGNGRDGYGMRDAEALHWWKTATLANQPHLQPDTELAARTPASWPRLASDDLADDLALVQRLVEERGMELLVLDQTRPDIGLPVAKVIVPGMRHFWARLGPGRLYDVPVDLGWLPAATPEAQMNPLGIFI
jgi:thiazole/oxazole-forming peptide maturase SagD family component